MKEASIRSVHAKLGLVLAVLLTLQALSGMLMAVGALVGVDDEDAPKQSAAPVVAQGATMAAPTHSGDSGAKAEEDEAGFVKIVKAVHLGGGKGGAVYRILLILAYLVQMGLGVTIYARVRSRKGRGRAT
jgi:hypothetical protein